MKFKVVNNVTCSFIFLLISMVGYSQSGNILTVYQASDLPVYFIDTLGNVKFTLPPGHYPVVKKNDKSYWPAKPGLRTFTNGICVVSGPTGYYWIDSLGNKLKHFGKKYSFMAAISSNTCLVRVKDETSIFGKFLFLNLKGEELFSGRKFKDATNFKGQYALVKLDTEKGEEGFLSVDGSFQLLTEANKHLASQNSDIDKNRQKEIQRIDDLIKLYKASYNANSLIFVAKRDVYDKYLLTYEEYIGRIECTNFKLTNIETGKIIWSSPIKDRTYFNLSDALEVKDQITRLFLTKTDLDVFPMEIYKFGNLTQLHLENSKLLVEIPSGISQLKNLEYLFLGYLPNLRSIPDDFQLLNRLEEIQLDHCKSSIVGLEDALVKMLTLKGIYSTNYNFSDSFSARITKVNPKISLNIEWDY